MTPSRGYISGASGIVARRIGEDGATTFLSPSEIIPGGLCPHLAHSLAPYAMTFTGGGSFPWMPAGDIVDVQCPNPSGAVVVRLKKNGDDFNVAVKSVRGECPCGYKPGDVSVWNDKRNIDIADTNLLLAWFVRMLGNSAPANSPLLRSTQGGCGYRLEREGGGCSAIAAVPCPPRIDFEMNLAYFTHRCRYHKFPKRENYGGDNWIPSGMCAELFHAAYPSCLAMIYGASGVPETIACPREGKVRVKIEVADRPAAELRKIAMSLLQKAGINTEIPTRRCYLSVVEAADDCPMTMREGAKFEFNMGELNQLCPAMFHNSYPVLANATSGIAAPWPPLASGGIVQCPDEASNITMDFFTRDRDA